MRGISGRSCFQSCACQPVHGGDEVPVSYYTRTGRKQAPVLQLTSGRGTTPSQKGDLALPPANLHASLPRSNGGPCLPNYPLQYHVEDSALSLSLPFFYPILTPSCLPDSAKIRYGTLLFPTPQEHFL